MIKALIIHSCSSEPLRYQVGYMYPFTGTTIDKIVEERESVVRICAYDSEGNILFKLNPDNPFLEIEYGKTTTSKENT